MPTYDFRCEACGHRFTVFVSISAKDKVTCSRCESSQVEQLFTGCSVRINESGGSCGTPAGFQGG